MDKNEWFKQADYNMDAPEFVFSGDRYFYSIFMCHLSIEKALKGLYIRFCFHPEQSKCPDSISR